jgi:uncharacterized membrane protein YkoI
MKKQVVTVLAAASLLAGCSQSVQNASQKFNELPPAVQKTARAQAPNGEIVDVSQHTQNGLQTYEIQFRGEQSNPRIEVASDGRLLSSEMPNPAGKVERFLTPTGATGTQFSALPETVQKTIQSKAPNAQIADISRHEDNGRVYYKVEFRDQDTNPPIEVAEDGSLLQK